MSASPLPAITTTSTTPSTPTPTPSVPLPPASQSSLPSDDSAFSTRLQNARHQQSAPSPSSASSNNKSSASTQANSPVNGQTGGKPNSTSTADSKSTSSSDADPSADADDTDSNVASLATTVLGLIDQSAADKDAATTSAVGDVKTTIGKALATADGTAQTAILSIPLVATAVPVPPQLPLPLTAQSQSQGDTSANSGVLQTTSTTSANTALSGLTLGKQTGAFSKTDDADSDADASDSSDSGDSTGSNLLVQSTGDAAQLAIGNLLGASHMAPAAAGTIATADNPSQSNTDLASLHGILNAPTLVTPPTGGAATHALTVNAPVNSPGFAQELGQQVAWLGGQQIKQAQIRLNPQDLGPLDVKVSIEHGRVDVIFMAQHPAAVTAVQQSLGQLNQMLTGQGLSLGQAMVGQQSAQQQFSGSQEQSGASTSAARGVEDESVDGVVGVSAQPVAIGLVDAFA